MIIPGRNTLCGLPTLRALQLTLPSVRTITPSAASDHLRDLLLHRRSPAQLAVRVMKQEEKVMETAPRQVTAWPVIGSAERVP
eukprot:gene11505-biopygen9037